MIGDLVRRRLRSADPSRALESPAPSRRQLAHHAGRLEKLWGTSGVIHTWLCSAWTTSHWTGLGAQVESFTE
ncbi:hypothetical protein [Nonomuraea dietziae]|uniref:hypothetical protein n=1 Tax=Nonomuraea dietziae TaxID=65515 RepID=UPI0031D7AE64